MSFQMRTWGSWSDRFAIKAWCAAELKSAFAGGRLARTGVRADVLLMSEERKPAATGGCQCGAVRYALYVPPQKAHACHCRMCQRAVGGAFALLAGAPKAEFAWTKGAPAFFASSNLAARGFCKDCGTPLSFAYNLPEARIYVTIGSFDDPAAVPIEQHFGVESKLPWVEFCEAMPAERTGEGAGDFYANMEINQG